MVIGRKTFMLNCMENAMDAVFFSFARLAYNGGSKVKL